MSEVQTKADSGQEQLDHLQEQFDSFKELLEQDGAGVGNGELSRIEELHSGISNGTGIHELTGRRTGPVQTDDFGGIYQIPPAASGKKSAKRPITEKQKEQLAQAREIKRRKREEEIFNKMMARQENHPTTPSLSPTTIVPISKPTIPKQEQTLDGLKQQEQQVETVLEVSETSEPSPFWSDYASETVRVVLVTGCIFLLKYLSKEKEQKADGVQYKFH